MSDVLVDVHGGRDTVDRDVLVVVWTGFAVHRVHTWHWDSLVASGYVSVRSRRETGQLNAETA